LVIEIVDPVDDFNDQNKPSHPELLDDLAVSFATADFDLKYLIRAICRTRAYQRTSARTSTREQPRLFERMAVKGLTGEQFFDSLALATGYRESSAEEGRALRDRFVTAFALTDRSVEPETSITRALTLMNGRFVDRATSLESGSTLIAACETPGMDNADRIESLYLAALSRKPTTDERQRMLKYVADGDKGREAERLADIFWVLLNAAEFQVNH
jgi:hypothetical protein